MWCDTKNMLRDRVESYRQVNLYNPHYDRHVIGPLRMLGENSFEASYSLFQTDLEGSSRLFSVGRYRVEVAGKLIKTMLVTPSNARLTSLPSATS